MNQPSQPRQVTLNDVLLLLGQSTVEVAWLRARVAELEQQLAQQQQAANGVVLHQDVRTVIADAE
jgi:hypothetical protein